MKFSTITLSLIAAICMLSLVPFARGQVPVLVTVDENGHGTAQLPSGNVPLPFALQADIGPGGLPAALTYIVTPPLPPLLVGDVQMTELPGTSQPLSDVVRFNPNGTMVFYSDKETTTPPEPLDLADIGLPTASYPNTFLIAEVGPEGNNGSIYTPTPNQPGFDPTGQFAMTYHLVSDVPEPTTMLAFAAIGGVATLRRRSA